MRYLRTLKWSSLVSGILLILLGIASLFGPQQSLIGLSLVISIAVLVFGISELIHYFTTDAGHRNGWMLAEAIVSTLIGAWMVFGSGAGSLSSIIPYVFAIFVFASGVIRIVESVDLKRRTFPYWGWMLVFGILLLILGILLFVSPLISAAFITIALSILLIGYGISNITVYINLQRAGDMLRDQFRE